MVFHQTPKQVPENMKTFGIQTPRLTTVPELGNALVAT